MALRVASYNTLADSYAHPAYYPHTETVWLRPSRRHEALVRRITELGADALCLQELEPERFEALREALPDYDALYQRKRGKPDGVAVFTRGRVLHRESLVYSDGTGHVALLAAVEHEGRRVGLATTHVKWERKGGALGVGEAEELLDAVARFPLECEGWVVCGDFNAPPTSALYRAVTARGWRDAYEAMDLPTSNANDAPKRIDFLFHTATLEATPEPLPSLAPTTPMPSETEPSDHLPLVARFAWG